MHMQVKHRLPSGFADIHADVIACGLILRVELLLSDMQQFMQSVEFFNSPPEKIL